MVIYSNLKMENVKLKKPKKKTNGYKMPDPLPSGIILEDIAKKKWRLGKSIGKGGFGEIYSAQDYTEKPKKIYPFVIKIEPHSNGPLFVEMHFYMRNAKAADIELFKKEHKLHSFGMPQYLGSGSHEYEGTKYRFVVLERYGTDIWKLFLENDRIFPTDTVFKLGIQILHVLEYIHAKGYIHADIKGSNILLGAGGESTRQVYLVDFGLCTHYSTNNKPDPKKAHNGTIEYLSRDAHLGLETRRGDLEILGYNLVQWLSGELPWEKNLSNPTIVQKNKENYMNDLSGFLKDCFLLKGKVPAALRNYMEYVINLKPEVKPDYIELHKILLSGLEEAEGDLNSPFVFKFKSTPLKRKSKSNTTPPKKKSKIISPQKEKSRNTRGAQKNIEKTTHNDDKEDLNSSTAGFTNEMLRIKKKLDSKKKTKAKTTSNTNSDRVTRSLKAIKYFDSSMNEDDN